MDSLASRKEELSDLVEDMEAYWGSDIQEPTNPEHGKYLDLHEDLMEVTSAMDDLVRTIHDLGGHLKSYEQGLVDFYSEVERKVVFLCWLRGEESIQYYHELDAGFQGRRPLEAERQG